MTTTLTEKNLSNQFPVGLTVLAIDNDSAVLENIQQMGIGCQYQVITCSNAFHALNRVRENKDCIDVILIDVHMPNMNGYEFLQHIEKEVDVPLIVMSFDDSTSNRMKAIMHGACDYWKKPFYEDQFRNMWMHVARKAWKENRLKTKFGSLEDNDRKKPGNDDSEFAIEATGGVVRDQKKSNSKESDLGECSPPPAKKPRVVWTDYLHNLFVMVVDEIGLDSAVPKKILEEMNVPGLTRENVASHLQKYRHQLKNKSTSGKSLVNTGQDQTTSVGFDGFDYHALGITGHEILIGTGTGTTDLMLTENQWPKHPLAEQDMTYDHPLAICPLNIVNNVRNFSHPVEDEVWPPSFQENNVPMMDTLGQQMQESLILHPSMNLHPSCMVVSGNSPSVIDIFHGYTNPAASIPVVGFTDGSFPANTQLPYAYSSRSDYSLYQDSLVNFGFDDKQIYVPRTSASGEELPKEDHALVNISPS